MTLVDDIPNHEPSNCLPSSNGLLKDKLASQLREAIMAGDLAPGERVIEGVWAKKFGAAQASVREAIHILMGEGLVTKDSGRSARVTLYTKEDVIAHYQVRAVLEGLAAYLVTESKVDVEPMDRALDGMSAAIEARDMRALIECDRRFHSSLIELSGNAFLIDSAMRLLTPLFAFVLIQVLTSEQGPETWKSDLPRHRRIVELIREGDPVMAEQYVKRSCWQFLDSANGVWGAATRARRSPGARRREMFE